MDNQTRLLVLRKDAKDNTSVYRLQKGWRLSFSCDAGLQADTVRLFWNYKSSGKGKLERYTELTWKKNDTVSEGFDYITDEVEITSAGSFHFYYTTDGSSSRETCDGYGYFIVDPVFTVGKSDKPLTMDAIQLQTVLPKLLGPLSEWKERLLVALKSGYNMIHFTPLQLLNSESNSSYSISDQLTLNPTFSTEGKEYSWEDVAKLVRFMREEWQVLSVTDLVYNHTANDSQWLVSHPESTYNLQNTPHLKPAYLIDRLVYYTSYNVASGQLSTKNIPPQIDSHHHINALREYLKNQIQELKLAEFYSVDVKRTVQQFTVSVKEVITALRKAPGELSHIIKKPHTELSIIQDSKYRREDSHMDVCSALAHYTDDILSVVDKEDDSLITEITADFERRVTELNSRKSEEIESHVRAAVENIIQGVSYRFLADHGPKLGTVTPSQPLVDYYFINKKNGYIAGDIEEDNSILDCDDQCRLIMAHNGWVFGDDPMKNFAESGSDVYLRRELVVWGDSVKLRYGDCPADSPYLWQRMEDYTKQTVGIFHGVRLDNCHSTPIHVAEYMMRYARGINPDLYVMAELFTSHEDLDNVFVNRLGLNSLIREGLSAWDAHEQGRLVYRYGGQPVGSFIQPNIQLLRPTVAHALLMDATHDNDSIVTKRTVEDSLALSAYVSMACCATGSNRGYNELVPHHISVVDERRLYTSWSDDSKTVPDAAHCNINTGIIKAKQILNELHRVMGGTGYNQVYVHDLGNEVVSITRHNPKTHRSYICVVRSAFSIDGGDNPRCDSLTFEGHLDKVILHGHVTKSSDSVTPFTKHKQYINGLKSHTTSLRTQVGIDQVPGAKWQRQSNQAQRISLQNFPPGSVLILSVLPDKALVSSQNAILKTVSEMQEYVAKGKQTTSPAALGLFEMMNKLTLPDLNDLMYHCEPEEKSINGYGAYNVPNHGSLVYTGLQGILSPLCRIRTENNLGHQICQNLRDGDWLIDYITSRLSHYKPLNQLRSYISELLAQVKCLPRYLIPCYFDLSLLALSMMINQTVWNKMSKFVSAGYPLIRELALCSQQFCAVVESAKLARLDTSVQRIYKHDLTDKLQIISISAGLPHFSEGIMRIWGRDTFISLRGLLLVTGRYKEAKAIILSFAGSVRHGLIPNLHGEGIHARYNCRDATWWWLQAIQDYCNITPNGVAILAEPVLRIYSSDQSEPYDSGEITQPLMQVVQEVLQRHADGIKFRERNAGSAIDEHMTDRGFDIEAGIDWTTGFVYGGNEWNCGTWMDKMGSSEKAGNKGKPATPRNGSAVELVGLCASAVLWLSDLYNKGLYPYAGVSAKRKDWEYKQEITFEVWYNLIKRNFEKNYWVDSSYTSLDHDPHPDFINRRNIYKDSVGADPRWTDYQLRPNFPIAIALAPDLFSTDHAVAALDMVEAHLVGPLGMKTLDNSDWNYNGDYINSDDSDNYKSAKGFNYHNGPEWLWPLGYYMRAKLVMSQRSDSSEHVMLDKLMRSIENKLTSHHLAVLSSDWRSLPELTNFNAQICADSCPAQAWSVSTMLDVLYDIDQIRASKSAQI